jgi:hypothetical protein
VWSAAEVEGKQKCPESSWIPSRIRLASAALGAIPWSWRARARRLEAAAAGGLGARGRSFG